MLRFVSSLSLGLVALTFIALAVANPTDDSVTKSLYVQAAMTRARSLLTDMQAQKAVEVLEEQLRNVNGNPQYLVLLRDAYRANIRDLCLAGKGEQARRYLDRLCILDPSAANDPTLRPAVDTPPRKFEPEPARQPRFTQVFPKFTIPSWSNPFAKKEELKSPPVINASVARGVAQDATIDDPFDRKNQRGDLSGSSKSVSARDLLARGAVEFKNERYAEARTCFEQACQTESSSLETCREQYAYCIIKGVSDTMEQPGVLPSKLSELRKQVEGAISMAPTKVMAKGQELLAYLDMRAKSAGAGVPQVTASISRVKHWGQNPEGWQVAESEHFRVFHRQNNEYAERIVQIAETTRLNMYRKWFGHDGIEWQPICELILHANVGAYTQMTGAPSNSPGHSRIESDPSGRVIARRMDMRIDAAGMLEAILPHETTHVVLAGMFGTGPVPRWADEGIAVLTEPNEKIDMHRRNLLKHHREGQLFSLKELMELKDYPAARRIPAFYAQSVVLVEFMTKQRDPKTFCEFVKDGMRSGYETALQRHYNLTFTQLDQVWQQQVIAGAERFVSQK